MRGPHIEPVDDGPGGRRLPQRDEPRESRLARTVHPHHGDAVVLVDGEIEALEHAQIAVAHRHLLEPRHQPAARGRGREREPDLRPLAVEFDALELLQHLDPALDLGGLGVLGPEAVDETLRPADLALLVGERLLQLLAPRHAFPLVERIVAAVVLDLAAGEGEGAPGQGIEETAVVADQDDAAAERLQVFLDPAQRAEVEVVGRFVQQQQVRFLEQEFGQRDAHLPPARKLGAGAVEIVAAETEALQHGLDARADPRGTGLVEAQLEVAHAIEQLQVVGTAGLERGERLAEVVQPLAQVEHAGERRLHLGEHGASRSRDAFLRQVADPHAARPHDPARVGRELAGQQPQQGCLARPVRPDQRDPFLRADDERKIPEQDPARELDADVLDRDHLGRGRNKVRAEPTPAGRGNIPAPPAGTSRRPRGHRRSAGLGRPAPGSAPRRAPATPAST